jgi:hypothetical protein
MMGIKESLGKIKDRIVQRGSSTREENKYESRTMTKEEVREHEYSPPRKEKKTHKTAQPSKAKMTVTKWSPGKPAPKQTPKSGLGGYLERRAKEEREKKERRDARKHELAEIESKAFKQGVTEYYRSKGRREGYQAAKSKNTSGWGRLPILGEPGTYGKKLATNVNANPFLHDIMGPQKILGAQQAKSNKRRQPTIKIVIDKGGNVKRGTRNKRKKPKRNSVWDFVGL